MEFTDEAKREIEKNLNEVVKIINVDQKGRTDIVNELRSTYYEAAESEACARGASIVNIDDARAAKASISSPRETAECFMKSLASTMKRAGFWPRLAAFILDYIALSAIIIIIMLPLFALMIFLGMPIWSIANEEIWSQAWNGISNSPGGLAFMVAGSFTALSAMIAYFGYFIVLEGHLGYTVGKYIMGLRVLRTDGTKIGYKEALLRNLTKYISNLIVIDALIMLIFFNKEKQRGSDRIADTMVVHVKTK